jgi:hypothetical protein
MDLGVGHGSVGVWRVQAWDRSTSLLYTLYAKIALNLCAPLARHPAGDI